MAAEDNPAGGDLPPHDFYDKLRLTFVNAGGSMRPYRRDICGFVWALTTPSLSAETRKSWLKEAFDMEMTQIVEKEINEYNWFRELCGHELYEKKMKQYYKEDLERERKKGEQSGFEKGEQSGFEKGIEQSKENFALNMLKNNYRLEEISRMTSLSMERVLQIARNNNLENS